MALGVLNNLSAIYAENNLNNTNNSLQTVLQQLSSGSKINSGADDAAGLSLVNGLAANSAALMQSETNATEGVGLLDVADGALSQVTSLLDRAITLATEASNGTLNDTQEGAANQEYQSILAEINNIGSTTTYNQQAVFSGSTTAIYTGDSSTTGSSIDDLNIRTLSESSVGDSGGTMSYSTGQDNVFLNLSSSTANASATDTLNQSGTTTIDVNYLVKGSAGSSTTANTQISVGTGTNYTNTAQGLISAINNSGLGLSATFATATQAGTAAVTNAIGNGDQTGILITGLGVGAGTSAGEIGSLTVGAAANPLSGTLNVVTADGVTHAITLGETGSTDNITNLANTINALGYGITASVASNTLTFTSANSAVSVSGSGITDQTSAATSDNPVWALGAGYAAALASSATVAGALGTVTVGNSSDALTGGTLDLNGTDGAALNLNLGTAGSTSTLAELAATINAKDVSDPTFGVTASLNAAGTVMTVEQLAGGAADATVAAASLTGTDPATTTAVSLANVPSTSNQVNTDAGATLGTLSIGGGGAGTDTLGAGALYITGANGATKTITVGVGNNTLAELASTINGDNLGVEATVSGTTLTFTTASADSKASIAQHTAFTDTTDGTANVTVLPSSNMPPSPTYYSVGLSSSAGITDTTTNITAGNTSLSSSTNDAFAVDDNGSGGVATISYTDGAGQSLSASDLTNQTDAQSALTDLNTAIIDVAAQDGYIGAQINTLNSISQVMSTQQENVVSAQNAIQATDYASATSDMSKYEILSQTGIAALAQANSVQQEVTKLLQ